MKDNGLLVQYFTANTTDSQNLWKKAAEDAAALKKMGATAVWFPPATKGAQGKEDMGYAPYDLYDLGEFDQKGSVGTRYGTKEEYLAAIKAMKAEGINVYADVAVRQKLGADKIENRGFRKSSAYFAVYTDPNSRFLVFFPGHKSCAGFPDNKAWSLEGFLSHMSGQPEIHELQSRLCIAGSGRQNVFLSAYTPLVHRL